MILDVLENADRYLTLNKGFKLAFSFLMMDDLKKLKPGHHEVRNDRVFAIVEDAPGRKRAGAELETHDKYIDIQLVLEGFDSMGWKRRATCSQISKPYDAKKDLQFYRDEPDLWLPVQAGMFAIFFPEDAHMPMISDGHLRKVVMKIAVDQ
jgi:biofilm protein TabA